MAKKKRSPAQLAADKARSEKMRQHASTEAMKAKIQADIVTEQIKETPPTASSNVEVDELKKQIEELRDLIKQTPPPMSNQPQVTSTGIVGTLTKYSIDPKDYPNPIDQLFQEPKLQLQGFNRNWWDLSWEVSRWAYETKDGRNVEEPKFQVELIRIIEDPETGEPSDKRYVLCKLTLFEDPAAALTIAREQNLDVPEYAEKAFLDAMRYIRVRDWVLEAFYPPKPSQKKSNKQEVVIGNRLVEVFEINSADSETMPFANLTKKL